MYARITIIGNDIVCECSGVADLRIPLDNGSLSKAAEWRKEYAKAVLTQDAGAFPGIGASIFVWLDASGWASNWVKGTGARVLEIAVDNGDSDAANALLALPWELLADNNGFLAADQVQVFEVYRSIGRSRNAAPAQPVHRDFALMFMAASPEGQTELNFENEEAAILEATEDMPVQVFVEESGCARLLKNRLAQEGPFEAVHISCHGEFLPDHGPVLALECPKGELALITPGVFSGILGEYPTPLVFLSACKTAADGNANAPEVTQSFVRELIRAGVPNVLGWDGYVYDSDAILFAKTFYGELAEHQ